MAIYRVQGPDGQIHKFQGPDGASPDQVLAVAQQQFATTPSAPSKPPIQVTPYKPNILERLQSGAQKITNATGTTNLALGARATGQVLQSKATGKPLDTTQSAPTNKQVIGSTGNLLGILATAAGALPAAEGTGALATASKAFNPGATRAARVIQGVVLGAEGAASQAANDNKSGAQIVGAGTLGGLMGAGSVFGLEKGSDMWKKAAGKRAADIYDAILGTKKTDIKGMAKANAYLKSQITKAQADGDTELVTKLQGQLRKTTGQQLVESGGLKGPIVQTKTGIQDRALQGVQETEQKLQPLLQSLDQQGVTIPTSKVTAPLEALKEENARLGVPTSPQVDTLINAIKSHGDTITPSQANALKRDYYGVLRAKNESFHMPPDQVPGFKGAVRQVASSLRQSIEDVSPTDGAGNVIKQLNHESGLHQQVFEKISNAIDNGHIKTIQDAQRILGSVLRPTNLLRKATDIGVGSILGPVGAAAVPAVDIAANSTPASVARAKISTKIANKTLTTAQTALLQRLLTQQAGRASAKITGRQ